MVFKLTSRHAICAMTYFYQFGRDRVVPAVEIAKARDIPKRYLQQVLAMLTRCGVLRAFHGGREKGYQLARPPEEITLYEILAPFEKWGEGPLLNACERKEQCGVWTCWEHVEEKMFAPLKAITLNEICASQSPIGNLSGESA